jgi:hypothetical protein
MDSWKIPRPRNRRSSETAMGKKRKKTPEERAAELERRADLDRRLLEMIEKYRQINARRRAATGE